MSEQLGPRPLAIVPLSSVKLRVSLPNKMEGALRCPRKGPLHEFIAFERCLEMRENDPHACGKCPQHLKAAHEAREARSGAVTPLRSRRQLPEE